MRKMCSGLCLLMATISITTAAEYKSDRGAVWAKINALPEELYPGMGEIRMSDEAYKGLLRVAPEVKARAYFDWRDEANGLTPAKSQGMCGSCYSFAIIGIFESWIKILYNYDYILSEQVLLSCADNHSGCCGGNFEVITWFSNHYPRFSACEPYGDGATSCESLSNCPPTCSSVACDMSCPPIYSLLDNYFTVDIHNETQVISTLHSWGPAYMSFAVHTDFLEYWYSGLGTSPWTDGVYINYQPSMEGGHAVLLIGYDSTNEYWICKNSWGVTGGPYGDGTFKIAWNGHDTDVLWGCGFADMTSQPITPTPTGSVTPTRTMTRTPTRTPTGTPTRTPTPPANDNCANPADLEVDECYCGNSFGAANDHDCGVGHAGGDVVFRVTGFLEGGLYFLDGLAEYDADWTLATVCDAITGDVLCVDTENFAYDLPCEDLSPIYSRSNIHKIFQAQQDTYYLWVDSNSTLGGGDYCLMVSLLVPPTASPTLTPSPTRTPTLTPTPTPTPRVLHVPRDYGTIQAAIAATNHGDYVLVANGTYTGTGNYNLTFGGKSIKVLSQNGPTACVIDCQHNGRGILFNRGENSSAVFQGFTILNAAATDGAGIYCDGTSPTIANCIIHGCSADSDGGGIAVDDGNPTVINCRFTYNFATRGGGLAGATNANPTLINCTFSVNSASSAGHGIAVRSSADVEIYASILWDDMGTEIWVEPLTGGTVTAMYSDIENSSGVYPGTGNLNANPMFVVGPLGGYYLDSPDSPCIDAGGQQSSQICFPSYYGSSTCLDEMTATGALDSHELDLGFHYAYHQFATKTPLSTYTPGSTLTPTRTPSPTFTLTPTDTPTLPPTSTATPSPIPTDPPNRIIRVPYDFPYIQDAVNDANPGDTVLVADGVYAGPGNNEVTFDGKAILVTSENGPFACTIDCPDGKTAFLFITGETENSILSGFMIRNSASSYGAVYCYDSSPEIVDCVFTSNTTTPIVVKEGHPFIVNCLFYGNISDARAGAIECQPQSEAEVAYCTFSDNSGPTCGAIHSDADAAITITGSILWGDSQPELSYDNIAPIVTCSDIQSDSLYPGTGNIKEDPSFDYGPHGDYYLYMLGYLRSPCVDGGDAPSSVVCFPIVGDVLCLDQLTTSKYGWEDNDRADMGFHYPCVVQPTPTPRPTATPTATPTVIPTDTPTPAFTMTPEPSATPACIHDGDPNFDSYITAGDAQSAFSIAVGFITPTYEQFCAADCNADGYVTAGDAQQIFSAAVGIGACIDPISR